MKTHIASLKIGVTYLIAGIGGTTYGKVTEIHPEDGTVLWVSNHPNAEGTHWARPSQVREEVSAGTYLGDKGEKVEG